ncbi:MAG: beta-lactamase family protein [Candidatus Latescibacteria bacterium]|nr:beta-lactamase family protein [Candidatus Latescibacterota bacterium]
MSDRLDSAVQSFIDAQQLSGAVIIVARHGAAAHFEARGMRDVETDAPMSKDTIFRIYSMTKAVGSVAAMMLCEEGKLQLDAPVSHYLPELQEMQVAPNPAAGEHTPVAAKQRMTVRDLLRHTSGLPGNVAVDTLYREAGLPPLSECDLREIVAHLNRVQLLFHPGTQWYYSIAADIVGRLVEVASGRLFDEFLAERIFQPLGMEDTGFHVPADKLHRFAAMYGPHPSPTGRHRNQVELSGAAQVPLLRRRTGLHRCRLPALLPDARGQGRASWTTAAASRYGRTNDPQPVTHVADTHPKATAGTLPRAGLWTGLFRSGAAVRLGTSLADRRIRLDRRSQHRVLDCAAVRISGDHPRPIHALLRPQPSRQTNRV